MMNEAMLKQLDEAALASTLPMLRDYYRHLRGQFKEFDELVKENLQTHKKVLDAGCGDGRQWGDVSSVLSAHPYVVGIDEDEVALKDNKVIKELHKGDLHHLPFDTAQFDLVLCRSVFEHLEDPPRVIAEFNRVLEEGGRVIVYTQNLANPIMFLSKVIPISLRIRLKQVIMRQEFYEGTFVNFYRCNTRSRFRTSFGQAGFKEVLFMRHGQCPGYWKNPLLINLFLIFEKLTDLRMFIFLKAHIVAIYDKADAAA